jgi:hypothetical protein
MNITNATSAEDYKLCSSFEEVRKTLLDDRYADRLDKPLAYWALPNDRRLPLAFLGRSVGELLATPFSELSATRGVGQKKISSLVKLLQRATSNDPPAVPFGLDDLVARTDGAEAEPLELQVGEGTDFDPTIVSEVLWDRWRETLMQRGVGREKLGRLAPTLRSLPTVIWHTPLRHYLEQSLADIRNLRTHGEKRVAVVLEVVHSVYETLCRCVTNDHLTVRVLPKFVVPIECWIADALGRVDRLSEPEVRECFTDPLLDQILTDTGTTVHRLAQGRLGIGGQVQSVRSQAREMGVTRARIYQLLEECTRVMQVRWPEGSDQTDQLVAALGDRTQGSPAGRLLEAMRELLFPHKELGLPADEGNGHSAGSG